MRRFAFAVLAAVVTSACSDATAPVEDDALIRGMLVKWSELSGQFAYVTNAALIHVDLDKRR